MMTRNLIPVFLCVLFAGCAASPTGQEPDIKTEAMKEEKRATMQEARLAITEQDWNRAIEAYRAVLELDPHDAVAVNNLALLLREKGRFREAATLLQEGIDYSPQTPELHYNLAVIAELYLLDLELALAHYRRFRELTEQEGPLVAGWIADLERRLE
jgi:Flp pilus assembly protein TadD